MQGDACGQIALGFVRVEERTPQAIAARATRENESPFVKSAAARTARDAVVRRQSSQISGVGFRERRAKRIRRPAALALSEIEADVSALSHCDKTARRSRNGILFCHFRKLDVARWGQPANMLLDPDVS
jgi:hypothetical protein